MKTSRSIVLVGVSLRYLCHTWSATSCGEDLADSDEFETLLVCVAEGARGVGWAAGVFVVAGGAALGVAGCAGFLAMSATLTVCLFGVSVELCSCS